MEAMSVSLRSDIMIAAIRIGDLDIALQSCSPFRFVLCGIVWGYCPVPYLSPCDET
jgi:hypothetical protein